MQLLFMAAVLYVAIFAAKMLVCCFAHSRWNKSDSVELFIFFACLIYISFFAIPSKSDDLYRWYANVNWYRIGAPKAYDFSDKVMPIQTKAIFIYNWSMQLVAKTDSNGFLQVIWLCVNYGSFYYMIYDFCQSHLVKKNQIYCYILLYFGLMPYFFSLSGLRSAAMSSIFAIGVYFAIFKGKEQMVYITTILAMFVHQSAAMALLIWLVYKIGRRKKAYRLIVCWTLVVQLMIKAAMLIPLEIFQFIGRKTYYYFYEYTAVTDSRLVFVLSIVIAMIYVGIICHGKERRIEEKKMQKYIDFFECAVLFCIGSFSNQVIFNRAIYIVAYCMLPYNFIVYKKFKHQDLISMIELFFAIGLNLYFLVTLHTYITFSI